MMMNEPDITDLLERELSHFGGVVASVVRDEHPRLSFAPSIHEQSSVRVRRQRHVVRHRDEIVVVREQIRYCNIR